MEKLVVSNGGQLKIHFTARGVPINNIIGFLGTSAKAPTQAIANSLDGAIKAAFVSSGLAAHYQAADAGLQNISIKSVNTADLVEYTGNGAVQVGSQAVADQLPYQASVVVTERTQFAGKQWRGRVYMGGFTELDSDHNGFIDTTLETACIDFLEAVESALSAQSYTHALLQKHLPERLDKKGNTLPERQAHAEPITALQIRNTTWGNQRRRFRRK